MKELCIDVYTNQYNDWFDDYEPKLKNGKYGNYYTLKIRKNSLGYIKKQARKKHLKIRVYEACWERSNNYRDNFYKHNKGPYRCRYCRKRLSPKYMQIDHIVPVGQVKKSSYARMLLKIRGIRNVNNYRNLAPSCSKCNRKKSDKLGMWYIKGMFGKYKLFWFIHYTVRVTAFMGVIYLIYTSINPLI